MAPRPCPACGATESRHALTRDGFDHATCSACGTLFVTPLPSDATIRAVYEDPTYRAQEADESHARREARSRAAVLARRGVHTVLEIGSGAGFFLEASAALGLRAEGIEPGRSGDRGAALGAQVHRTWLDGFTPTQRYDAIALWEVIEHLPEPGRSLKLLHDWLKPGGVLALSTPSISGVPARLLRHRFPMISPPEHLELFSRRGLATLLVRTGFRPFRWTSFSKADPDTLARGFRRYFLGSSTPARAIAAGLGRAAALPARILDRAGLGTSFEVYSAAVDAEASGYQA